MTFLLHIALSLVASTILGMIWYSPLVFGSIWMSVTFPGKRPEEIDEGMAGYITAWVGSGIVAASLCTLLQISLKVNSLEVSLQAASLIAAIIFGSQITHAGFERKSPSVFLINVGYDVICVFMSTIILHYLG